jgi:hypothetical protein
MLIVAPNRLLDPALPETKVQHHSPLSFIGFSPKSLIVSVRPDLATLTTNQLSEDLFPSHSPSKVPVDLNTLAIAITPRNWVFLRDEGTRKKDTLEKDAPEVGPKVKAMA